MAIAEDMRPCKSMSIAPNPASGNRNVVDNENSLGIMKDLFVISCQ
jgi:hypothetical protein